MKSIPQTLIASTVVLAASSALLGQEKPPAAPGANASHAEAAAEPELGTLDRLFNRELPDVIGQSKISVNARLRWEYADQDAVGGGSNDQDASNAFTLRTRFGLTSGMFYGFQGMIEAENIAVLGPSHNYNAAGSNRNGAGRTVVADPPTTELNQAWLSYHNWNTLAKAGRQRLVLDNQRFVGDVGWRQNMQTFDAVTLENRCVDHLRVFYGYMWEVNRVFGDVDNLPDPLTDFDSDSHLINVSYDACEYGKLTGYTYLLDLDNAATEINSTATYGASLAGHAALTEEVDLKYRGEFAWQSDYANNPADYEAEYYAIEVGADIKPFQAGVGYEVLGTDNNQGFKTPLATLHGFNGWADVFLNTPGKGLRDLYGFAQMTLPWQIPLRVVYHKFNADSGGDDYGSEVDVQVSKKLGQHWAALAKYSFYDGKDDPYGAYSAIDVHKGWVQVEFNF